MISYSQWKESRADSIQIIAQQLAEERYTNLFSFDDSILAQEKMVAPCIAQSPVILEAATLVYQENRAVKDIFLDLFYGAFSKISQKDI